MIAQAAEEGSRQVAHLRLLIDQGMTLAKAARHVWPDEGAEAARSKARRALKGANVAPPRSRPSAGVVDASTPVVEEVRFTVPPGDPKVYNNFPRITGDFLVISDLHIPYHDDGFINEAIMAARYWDISRFIIAGDFMDGNQFSKRGHRLGYQRKWQDDALIGEGVIRVLEEAFPDGGLVLSGNHDKWFEGNFKGHADADFLYARLFRSSDRVEWTHFEQAEVVSGGNTFQVLHGSNYSGANPLGVGQKHAANFGCHIIMGHQHHACEGRSHSGNLQVVCMGGMHDPAKLAYLHESPRTNPRATQSYVILKDGYAKHVYKR